MKLKLITFSFLFLMLSNATPYVHAQTESIFTNLDANHIFGESITFTGSIDPTAAAESIEVTFRSKATGKSTVIPMSNAEGSLTAEYKFQSQDYIPPFGIIEYWFNASLNDGSDAQSQTKTYVYIDNRYTWQNITYEDLYTVYWVEGDRSFGQAVLDAALEANTSYNAYLDLPIPNQLRIYVYPTNSALQSALEITNARWVAGHADPANNSILVSIPTSFDQQLTIQRQIPHEITHIRLYLYLQENYHNLPVWYSEGLASLSEQYTLPEYWQILQAAWRDGQIIPFTDICTTFPVDTSNASLAYAQADSFTRFIYKEYGKLGLQNLLDAYALGHSCQNGVDSAFQVSLQELEKNWYQDTFNSSILPDTATLALSWIIILVLLLLSPIGILLLSKRR